MTDLDIGVVARFFVAGRPRTKGHMKPMPHRRANGKLAITVHDRDETKAWLQALIAGIREQNGIRAIVKGRKVTGVEAPWPWVGPVEVDSTFYFARDISVNGGLPVPSHMTPYPTDDKLGDVDTLQRCVLDALTQSGAIADDRWVVEETARKRWISDGPGEPGVLCVVRVAS